MRNIIKPGDPHASTLYFRMAKFGRDRMPHIGSELPDEAGLKLIERWIAGMNGGAEATEGSPDGASPDQLLTSPKSALPLARRLGRGELNATRTGSAADGGGEAAGRTGSRLVRGLPARGR